MSDVSDEMVEAAAEEIYRLMNSWTADDWMDEDAEQNIARAALEAVEPLIRPALYRRYRAQRDTARAENKRLRDAVLGLVNELDGEPYYFDTTALRALLSEAGERP